VFLNKVADWQSGVPSFIHAMKAVFEPLYDLLKSQPMAFKIDDQIFHCPVKRAVTSKRRQLVSTPLSKEMHQDHRCSLISIDEAWPPEIACTRTAALRAIPRWYPL
jgi:hypothetical protein